MRFRITSYNVCYTKLLRNIMGITGNIREITGNHAGTTIITTTIITILMDLITITGITGPITMVIMVEAIFS